MLNCSVSYGLAWRKRGEMFRLVSTAVIAVRRESGTVRRRPGPLRASDISRLDRSSFVKRTAQPSQSSRMPCCMPTHHQHEDQACTIPSSQQQEFSPLTRTSRSSYTQSRACGLSRFTQQRSRMKDCDSIDNMFWPSLLQKRRKVLLNTSPSRTISNLDCSIP